MFTKKHSRLIQEAIAECASLRGLQPSEGHEEFDVWLASVEDALVQAEKTIRSLKTSLKPFAEYNEALSVQLGGSEQVHSIINAVGVRTITRSHFANAARALHGHS